MIWKKQLPLIFILSLAACAEQKRFNEVHDATLEMNKTTQDMDRKTQKLSETSDRLDSKTGQVVELTTQMKEHADRLVVMTESLEQRSGSLVDMTDELYDALRQGNSLQLRREAYDAVLKAPTMFKKIAEAGKYFMSFEFQLWNQLGQDNSETKRDELLQQAAQEFFMEIEGLAPRDGSVDPTASPNADQINSQKNRTASFNSFAVTLHQINRKQTAVIEARKLPAVSLLTVLEEALLSKSAGTAKNAGKSGAYREVLAHEPKAIQILQARYNLFPAMFVDFVSQINDKSIFAKAWMTFVGWDLDLDKLNPTQLEYLQNEVLVHATHARNLLLKIGVKPQLDFRVKRLFKNVRIKVSGNAKSSIIAEQTKLVGLIKDLQKDLN